MNLAELADAQGIGLAPVDQWGWKGRLPGQARAAGRLILASQETAAGPSRQDPAGRYARVSSAGQKAGPGPVSTRVRARAGVPVAGAGASQVDGAA